MSYDQRDEAGRNSGNVRTDNKSRRGSWLWSVIVLITVWFLTGFPFSKLSPETVEVRGEVESGAYGRLPDSWSEQLNVTVDQTVLDWALSHGYGEATLRGSIKAAALERDPSTGQPSPGTGQRVSMFDLLALPGIESDLATAQVNPYEPNPTGNCVAWWEIVKRLDLGPQWIAEQHAALRKIAHSLDLDPYKIYGSCGAGALGFNQGMPDNWWNLMGPGFNPWDRETAAEFTARYFVTHGYFTRGRRAAVHSYNPGAPDATYTDPIINHANELAASYASLGLPEPSATLLVYGTEDDSRLGAVEPLDVETTVTTESLNQLTIWPVNCPPGSWDFGDYNPFQAFSPVGHTGNDLLCPTGTPVKASGAGYVEYASWWPEEPWWEASNLGYGRAVWILHGYVDGKPLFTVYAHNSELLVRPGQRVEAGDVIAYSGNTGAGTGPHLHFEVRLGGGTRNGGTDDQGRTWDKYSPQRPADWIGASRSFIVDGLPTSSPSQLITGGMMQEVNLTLLRTPVVDAAMQVGSVRTKLHDAFEAAAELSRVLKDVRNFADEVQPQIDKINEVLAPLGIKLDPGSLEALEKADQLMSMIEDGLQVVMELDKFLTNLHAILSQWAIAGQDRTLGLDPLLNWRLYPPESGGE